MCIGTPSFSTDEQRTSELIAKQLEAATGLIVLMRTSMDALSEREESGLLCGPRTGLQKSVGLTRQALAC